MNERIKQFAEQADNFADDKIQMPGEYHPDWHDVRDEKFAELIVRGCLVQVNEVYTSLDNKDKRVGAAAVGLTIAAHFGVEE